MDIHHLRDSVQRQSRCSLNSRIVPLTDRDLRIYIIEAFPSTVSAPTSLPLILLLHGFPELAYSWRKVLGPLAVAHEGYHVVAPDLRGYGNTVEVCKHPPPQVEYDASVAPFHPLNIAQDICSLVNALGHSFASILVGHDFGSLIAGHCITAHPELFRSVVFMSVPFTGAEQLLAQPHNPHRGDPAHVAPKDKSLPTLAQALSTALAALTPPRKHYTSYFSTRDANKDMLGDCPEDLYTFLGGYYHIKSGAWHGNTTHPLPSASNPSATIDAIVHDLTTLPEYYVMPAHENMRELIARHARQDPLLTWPPDEVEAGNVYAAEFGRTGFQGGLNYYRAALEPPPMEREGEVALLSGQRVGIPVAFISGARDWGVYQMPGALEKMKIRFAMESEDVVLIKGAGHWVQQEAPDQVIAALLQFLDKVKRTAIQ